MDAEFWKDVGIGLATLAVLGAFFLWLVWPRILPPLRDEHEDSSVG